jgi:transposase
VNRVPRRGPLPRFTHLSPEAERLYAEEGLTLREVARALGVSLNTVQRLLAAVPRRRPGPRPVARRPG